MQPNGGYYYPPNQQQQPPHPNQAPTFGYPQPFPFATTQGYASINSQTPYLFQSSYAQPFGVAAQSHPSTFAYPHYALPIAGQPQTSLRPPIPQRPIETPPVRQAQSSILPQQAYRPFSSLPARPSFSTTSTSSATPVSKRQESAVKAQPTALVPKPIPSKPSTQATANFERNNSPPCVAQLKDQDRLRTEPRFQTSNMSATDEYGAVLREISGMTVDKLKASLRRLNESFNTHLKYSGLKNELYLRLRSEVDRIYNYERAKFPIVKTIVSQCYRGQLHAAPPPLPSHSAPSYPASSASSSAATGYGGTTNNYGASTSTASSAYNSGYGRPLGGTPAGGLGAGASRFGAGGYAANSSNSLGGGGATGAAINRWQNDDVPIKFRPSPFYRVEKSLSPPVTLFKADPGDRKVATVNFALTEAQKTLINKAKESISNPQYEVRLYCTSDNNYSIGRPHASQFPAPIEFPQTSEIKLNNVTINVNTKGIKKQPGTTPPVNLSSKKGPTVNTGPGQLNKVELIYANTERTTYYMVAYLVETTPVKKVVEKVKAGRTKPKEEVIQSIKDLNSDEEIAAGPLGLSLRDPLSFARIGVPIRSRFCNHISCFDAETWFEMNEQTPTWGCPICSKTLKFEDMVVDGYFEDILKTCSSSVDAVTVNPDGTWRSDDNKFGTGPPRPEKSSTNNSSTRNSPRREDQDREESTKPDINGNGNGNGKGKAKAQPEALTIDSDSDDDGPLAKRPRIGGFGAGGASHSGSPFLNGSGTNGVRNGRGASEVLDLTLSDSDDDQSAPVTRPPPQPAAPSISRQNSNSMARNGSAGGGGGAPGGVKTVADVQRDIDAMQQRMREEYGDDWRTRFNI
ncbi:hypothetical protein JCM3765_005633 [Sporobolomyces pararoseus]